MLEELARRIATAKVLLVTTQRPDVVVPWHVPTALSQLALRPLGDDAVAAVVRAVAGAPLPPGGRRAHRGARRRQSRSSPRSWCVRCSRSASWWPGPVACSSPRGRSPSCSIPATIQEVVAARLDSLGPSHQARRAGGGRARAAVPQPAAGGAARRRRRSTCRRELAELERRGLVHRKTALSSDEFRFGESLTQEVAYEGLLLRAAPPAPRTGRRRCSRRSPSGAGGEARSRSWRTTTRAATTTAKPWRRCWRRLARPEQVPSYRVAADYYRQAWQLAETMLGEREDGSHHRAALEAAHGLARLDGLLRRGRHGRRGAGGRRAAGSWPSCSATRSGSAAAPTITASSPPCGRTPTSPAGSRSPSVASRWPRPRRPARRWRLGLSRGLCVQLRGRRPLRAGARHASSAASADARGVRPSRAADRHLPERALGARPRAVRPGRARRRRWRAPATSLRDGASRRTTARCGSAHRQPCSPPCTTCAASTPRRSAGPTSALEIGEAIANENVYPTGAALASGRAAAARRAGRSPASTSSASRRGSAPRDRCSSTRASSARRCWRPASSSRRTASRPSWWARTGGRLRQATGAGGARRRARAPRAARRGGAALRRGGRAWRRRSARAPRSPPRCSAPRRSHCAGRGAGWCSNGPPRCAPSWACTTIAPRLERLLAAVRPRRSRGHGASRPRTARGRARLHPDADLSGARRARRGTPARGARERRAGADRRRPARALLLRCGARRGGRAGRRRRRR